MKRLLSVLVILASLFIVSPLAAYADAPYQPWEYAAAHCAGVPVATVHSGFARYSDWYGAQHQVTDWQGSYESRVNGFADQIGCPMLLDSGALTRWAKHYAPVYLWLLSDSPVPY